MTRAEIEAVFERVRTWPEDRQAYAAWLLLDLEQGDNAPDELTDEDRAALDEAEAEEEVGKFATDEEIEAVFARRRG